MSSPRPEPGRAWESGDVFDGLPYALYLPRQTAYAVRATTPLEAKLEEIYCYKLTHPDGFAFQRLYTGDGRTDQALVVRDNDLVLVREGYHPVVVALGYHCYYLNVLAGDFRSMQASDDPTAPGSARPGARARPTRRSTN